MDVMQNKDGVSSRAVVNDPNRKSDSGKMPVKMKQMNK